MIKRTFLDKCNTIIKNSTNNTSLNPVAELNYGQDITRALVHFNMDDIKDMYDNGSFVYSGTTHTLKLTNCGSVNNIVNENLFNKSTCVTKNRASSFSLVVFRLPTNWDMGNGYDFDMDYWVLHNKHVSKDGCNWYQSKNGVSWKFNFFCLATDDELNDINTDKYLYDEEEDEHIKITQERAEMLKDEEAIYVISKDSPQDGIYTADQLAGFIDKENDIIVDKKFFEVGNENLEFDISKYVEDVLTGKYNNNGLCIAFAPELEESDEKLIQYVGFFTNMTHTFFHPVVESRSNIRIKDDRSEFRIGKKNKLYLYISDDGFPVNLDEIPTCTIDGETYDVVQEMTGIYSATIDAKKDKFSEGTIYYDEWSNLKLNEEELDDVEMEFVPKKNAISFINPAKDTRSVVPFLYGINDGEKISQGLPRTIFVEFRKKFTTEKKLNIPESKYRLYVKDATREIDVIDFDYINHSFMQDYFVIETNKLIPNVYYIDILENGTIHKKALEFEIVSNVTERYV